MKYDFLVFIGRFQPLHLGHQHVIDRALALADRVILLVGSTNQARNIRDPWTFSERKAMIRLVYPSDRVIVVEIPDYPYNNDGWIASVQQIVYETIVANMPGNKPGITLHGWKDAKVGLIGYNKDHTSFYLKMFPEWSSEDVPVYTVSTGISLDATDIRRRYFEAFDASKVLRINFQPTIDPRIMDYLLEFFDSSYFAGLQEEYEWVQDYKEEWSNTPYPVNFLCADAVVVQSGHVLMIERGAMPGKGQLALPGGYVHTTETALQCAIRELREETRLKVPEPVLLGSIKEQKVFDEPQRSVRGRVVSNAFFFKLTDQVELPKVKGGDDAKAAMWVPLGLLRPHECFEDHYHIVKYFTRETV